MVLGSGLPRTIFGKSMPRTRDHAPAGCRKALDRGVANTSAGSGEKERASGLVRCRHFRCSWIQPCLDPRRSRTRACKGNTIMQTEWSLLPELDLPRSDAIAHPERRPRHGADGKLRGEPCNRFLECQPAFERGRLFAGPGPDLRHSRAGGEIGVRLGGGYRLHLAAQADLTLQ